MINSLKIQNYQSHEDSTLEFVPGVNIIIGPSDSGKSAISRAFRWVKNNKPLGEDFRSNWGGDTSVSINLDEGKITRLRNKKFNGYILNDKDELEAFKTDVPEQVTEILNIDEINLQQQLESHFLLSATPGEVGHHFNKIAHIDQIDKGLKNIQSWINQINQDIKTQTSLIETNTEKAKGFDYLEKFEIELEVLEEMRIQSTNKVISKNSLKKLINQINVIGIQIQNEQKLISFETSVDSLLNNFSSKTRLIEDYNSLVELMNIIEKNDKRLKEYQNLINLESKVLSLLNLIESKKEKQKNLRRLKVLIRDINENNNEKSNIASKLTVLEDKFKELMPEVCPLCGK